MWYREAGSRENPSILLLHGYPTSSNMFRNLIPLLASNFHVVAPDLPGFGFTTVDCHYEYTFDNLANTVHDFVSAVGLSKYIIYIFDYGSPVGLRLALKDPSAVNGIIVQNGNAYEEGLDDRFWAPLKSYWMKDKTDEECSRLLKDYVKNPENIMCQYLDGVEDPLKLDPSAYTLDIALFEKSKAPDIQVRLFYDYKHNVEMYPKFQEYFRTYKPSTIVLWGKNDRIFTPEGAMAYLKDIKTASLKFYDTGHFALETHVDNIAEDILEFFNNL